MATKRHPGHFPANSTIRCYCSYTLQQDYELSAGEDKTIGSDSTITVANDDGIVAYNVVAGDLVIESDGGIDASADTEGSYRIAGVRILGAGENAGAGDMINRGLMASVIADETGGWIDALGLNVESDAFGAGSAVVRAHATTNEGIIRADAGARNMDSYVSGVEFFSVVEDNATGSATLLAGDMQNSVGATIGASGGMWAHGFALGAETDGAGDATTGLDEITNDGAITVVDASEEAIGISFSGNTEAGGNTAITVASLVNGSDGVITVSGAAYTAGIDFHSRASDDGDAAITVDSVLNQGNIIARDGTVDTTGIAFFSSASDAGNATVTITGDVTNEAGGEIVSSGHGISLSTSEDGSGSATISVGGGLVNAGTIQSTTDGYGIYIGAGVTIADGIINRGVIQGAGTTPYAIYIEDDAGSGAPAIAVSGDDARLVGAVHAIDSTLTVTGQSDDGYFATEGAFELLGLAIAADGALEIADGAHTIAVGNGGFVNRGNLRVPTGITATINGDYSQAGDGAYVVQLDVSGQTPTHGTLAVDGNVDLDNRLSVTMSDAVRTFLEESGDETEIGEVLTYTGSATNSDAIIVMSNDLLMEFTAEDDGNGINLRAAPIDSYAEALRSEGAVGGAGDDVSGIALALGTVLDDAKRTGGLSQDMKAVVAKLQALTPKERGKAMKEIKETSTAVAVNSVAAKVGGGFSGAMQNRVAAMTAPDGFGGVGTGLAAGDFGIDRVWWLKPYGSVGEQNDKNGVPGYDMDSRGLAFGFDQDLSPTWRAGVAVSYTNTDVDSNAGNQNVDIDTYQIGVYGTRELDEDNRLNVQAGIGRGRYDSRRVIPSLGGVTEASYDSTNFMGSVALERDFVRSTNALLRASVSAEYAYVNMDGYSENGAGVLDLEIAGSDQDSLILGLGGEYQHANAGQGIFSINAFAGYDALADQSSVSTQLAAGGPAFTTEGMDPERFLFRGGLGYEFRNGDNMVIETRYDTELRKGFDDHAFSVKLKYSF